MWVINGENLKFVSQKSKSTSKKKDNIKSEDDVTSLIDEQDLPFLL